LHIFGADVNLSSDVQIIEGTPMAEIPSRLKRNADQHLLPGSAEDALESSFESSETAEDIPIFCAGGCGEVMGYVRIGYSIPPRWCPDCESAKASERAVTEAMPSDSDELAELRSPPRDLRRAHFAQVLAVLLIFAGSIYIALGQPIGIYLAAFGTVAWIGVGLVLWRLRN
jgi:hypothetical protein